MCNVKKKILCSKFFGEPLKNECNFVWEMQIPASNLAPNFGIISGMSYVNTSNLLKVHNSTILSADGKIGQNEQHATNGTLLFLPHTRCIRM